VKAADKMKPYQEASAFVVQATDTPTQANVFAVQTSTSFYLMVHVQYALQTNNGTDNPVHASQVISNLQANVHKNAQVHKQSMLMEDATPVR
jgi:hypothetical protein